MTSGGDPGTRPPPAGDQLPVGPAVLIVDDDPDQLELLRIAFGRAGLRTIGVTTAAAALRALATEQIGCVVADLRMPGTSGIDLARAVRDQPATLTLPFIVMTGYSGGEGVIEALDAGADDFVGKTVGLDELIARVQAHLRTHAAWTEALVAELQTRASAIQAIGQLALSSVPEKAAEAVVKELAERTDSAFVGVYRLVGDDQLDPLATWDATDGTILGGAQLPPTRSRYLVRRARQGPWAELLTSSAPGELANPFWASGLDLASGAPIHSGDDLVGLLAIATVIDTPEAPVSMLRARLLASATDYASVLSAVAGSEIADRRKSATDKAALRGVLSGRRFFSVYQPIVPIGTGRSIGYEALTRFADGAPPDVRFARAAALGLGSEFELAAIDSAITSAPSIKPDQFLAVNVSPDLVVNAGKLLRRVLGRWRGRIVLEVSELVPVANYEAFRWSVGRLHDVEVAIDHAGAEYATLRHVRELEATWVKLDRALVSHIDADPMRLSLVAGLAHFAGSTGARLVAQGVDRQEEADALAGIGVEFGQGELYGRPERGKD
jgi:EAL domain-containing protein (putative c-di-GMP-specific phosphodiesterase class I)/DNA-binding response OmpR family regulator